MSMETKALAFELKASDDGGSFEGWAACFGNIDAGRDIIDPSAFNETLDLFLKRGFLARFHDWNRPIGKPTRARVEPRGLYIAGSISDTPDGREMRTLLIDKVIQGLSIGYDAKGTRVLPNAEAVEDYWRSIAYNPTDDDLMAKSLGPVRLLAKVHLYETSPVPVPMNGLCDVTAAKAFLPSDTSREKAAGGSGSLPLASRSRGWDAGAAEGRVRSWAGASDAPNGKYAGAFFWRAPETEGFGDYKLQFADVIDGTLTAIPRGIFAVAAVLQGGRGGVDIPDADKAAIRRRVSRYYARMRDKFDDEELTAPWDGADDDDKGLTFDQHSESVREAVQGFITRARGLAALKAAEGRALSDRRLAQLVTLRDDLDGLLRTTESATPDGDLLYAQFLQSEARLLGAPV